MTKIPLFLIRVQIYSKNETWQKRHKLLAPCFSQEMFTSVVDSTNANAATLMHILDGKRRQQAYGQVPTLMADLKMCNLDIICGEF